MIMRDVDNLKMGNSSTLDEPIMETLVFIIEIFI
jgi:hypothetical protein